MPDWQHLVRSRLGPLGLEPAREEEIVSELAHHLEDLYEGFLQQGMKQSHAVEKALASVEDWAALRRGIRRAERGHPAAALVVLTGLPVLLLVAYYAWLRAPAPGLRSLGACLSLFAVGILLAALSRFAGGRPRDRIFAALLPPIFFGFMSFNSSLLSSFMLQGSVNLWESLGRTFAQFAAPAVAIVSGGALFLFAEARRRRAAGSPDRDGVCAPTAMFAVSGSSGQDPLTGAPSLRLPWLQLAFALTAFFVSLAASERWVHGPAQFSWWITIGSVEVSVSIPQLVALSLLGILLAAACRRLGGDRRAQVLTAMLPAAGWLAYLINGMIFFGRHAYPFFQGAKFAGIVVSQVMIPALAMVLSAVAVARRQRLASSLGLRGMRVSKT